MDAWIIDILRGYGLAGVVIFGLGTVVVAQNRKINRLHEQRAAEREALMKLYGEASNAQRITAEVTAKRNEIMENLGAAMVTQANAGDRLRDRVEGQAEMFKEKFGDVRHVIDATGESYRVLNGLVTEIRNGLNQLVGDVRAVAVDVKVAGKQGHRT